MKRDEAVTLSCPVKHFMYSALPITFEKENSLFNINQGTELVCCCSLALFLLNAFQIVSLHSRRSLCSVGPLARLFWSASTINSNPSRGYIPEIERYRHIGPFLQTIASNQAQKMAGLISASISQCSTLVGLLFVVCNLTAAAWMTTAPTQYSQRSHHKKYHHGSHSIGWSKTQLSYRDDELNDAIENKDKKSSPASDFKSRMKRAALQNNRSSSRRRTGASWRPSNVKTVASLEDFSNVIQEGRTKNQLVVVRFYALWCKKCHSVRPSFDKVASSKPQVIFVDVPVTNTNVELHQGLGVKSVPFAHIYCPEKGLVVEEKISRRRFSEFEELVDHYFSNI